jgi:hypothetical protein
MARISEPRRRKLAEYLARTHPALISATEWNELRTELAPVPDRALRQLLRDCGVPLSPEIDGIRQDSFIDLERTLMAMLADYERSDSRHKQLCRNLVITAKDHARLAAQRLPENDPRRRAKEEMMLWMLTWLENPGVFAAWLDLRKKMLA